MKSARLLLDTHVWIWLALGQPRTLKPAVLRAIERAGDTGALLVSVVSVWELAILEAKGRLVLPMPIDEWVALALDRPELLLVSLEKPAVVIDSCRLPGGFHADPADRLLVAVARNEGAALVTRDRKILDYAASGHVAALPA